LSYREAARLQSFPDSFCFVGSQRAIATQIGNAVPPVFAYQIARQLGEAGKFLDLFAGAGGFGLGFTWAGWKPILANDIHPTFLETYAQNIHGNTLVGDIRDPNVMQGIVDTVRKARRTASGPFWILGGPPCQGFSTAGNPRTMTDERNLLFWSYKSIVEELRPDGFVFENVSGLLTMDRGRVLRIVTDALGSVTETFQKWVIGTEDFAIPQRRTRLVLLGTNGENVAAPLRITSMSGDSDLFGEMAPAVTVDEAIGDLPALAQGEDGSWKPYRFAPRSWYQLLMRGGIDVATYLERIVNREPPPAGV
jgi:DNA (cytosine-5)-methyltransferase 1